MYDTNMYKQCYREALTKYCGYVLRKMQISSNLVKNHTKKCELKYIYIQA